MATPQSRWQVFTAAPHRVMMLGGAVQLGITMVYWLFELTHRHGLIGAPWPSVPGPFSHAFLMIYGLFPFFMFGFLMTTYPRWMGSVPVPRWAYSAVFVAMSAGVGLFYGGLYSHRGVAAAGVVVWLLGFAGGYLSLWRVYLAAPPGDRFYERWLNLWLGLGGVGAVVYLFALTGGQWTLWPWSLALGLWGFMVPVAVTVAHRMIPFFSNVVIPSYRVYQPRLLFSVMIVGIAAHGMLEVTRMERWQWLVDIPVAVIGFYYVFRWGFVQSFRDRLLAMLHISFAWFAVAMALYAANSLLLLVTQRDVLGLAPLHAIGIGFLTSITVAMATRVTLGHSGRRLAADRFTWLVFWGVGAVAVVRVVAALPLPGAWSPWGNLLAAGGWLLVLLPWVIRYAPIYLRVRADGKPG